MIINHVHTYVFLETRKNGVDMYKCDDPHCHHFAPRKLILNKASICSKCRQSELILDWKALRNKRPLCINCSETNEAKQFRANKAFVEGILSRKEA